MIFCAGKNGKNGILITASCLSFIDFLLFLQIGQLIA